MLQFTCVERTISVDAVKKGECMRSEAIFRAKEIIANK
jgi:hypothetical protein